MSDFPTLRIYASLKCPANHGKGDDKEHACRYMIVMILISQACTKRLENGKVKLAIGVLTSVKHLGTADNNAKAMFEDYSGNLCNFY